MKLVKSFILLSLLLPLLLLAGEDRVAIGTRPMNEDAKAQIQSEKEKNATANDEEGSREAAGFIFDRYPPVYFSNSHHWLIGVTVLDNDKFTLEFEDGSVWKINSYDGTKALNWRANDPLIITQNHRWFSSYDYRIINKNNGSSIEANLFLGPIEKGPYTCYIIAIDYGHKEVFLSDNTHWEISSLDSSIFKDWALSDAIIIGSNSGWDSNSDALLINVNMNNAARAKQF